LTAGLDAPDDSKTGVAEGRYSEAARNAAYDRLLGLSAETTSSGFA
jgi:hypothetical protein